MMVRNMFQGYGRIDVQVWVPMLDVKLQELGMRVGTVLIR